MNETAELNCLVAKCNRSINTRTMTDGSYETAKSLIDLSAEEVFADGKLKEKMSQILKLPGNAECVECGQEGK
jgi:hypothetical protein